MPKRRSRRSSAAVVPLHGEVAKAKARMQVVAAQRFEALAGYDEQINTAGKPLPLPGGGTGGVMRWWSPGLRDSAGDVLRRLPLQRAASRDLVRANPIAAGAINTNVDRVVGTGLALVAQPNRSVLGWTPEQALNWKRLVQTEYSLWADSPECDIAGEQNFYEKQALTLRSALESGDCFTLLPDGASSPSMPYRLRLQTLEADRIGNPGGRADTAAIAGGIRRAAGRLDAQAFHVYDRHPGAAYVGLVTDRFAGQWVDRVGRSGRRRMLHHFRQLRPEQPRGVPYLSPVVEHLKQLGRYTEAEIQAAVVSAFFTVFIETDPGTTAAPVFGTTDAAVAANPEIELGAGAVVGLAKGEKATFADPSRPNEKFEPFVRAIVQQIGVGLGIPHELLLKQFNASYSASKAALLDAWMWFRSMRTWLARSFCQPVYETWMAEAVASGRIPAPGFFENPLLRWAYTRAWWHGDSQGSINPKDEVDAYLAAVDGRIMTRERAEWELFGSDWYETLDEKRVEQQLLADADLLPQPKAGAAAPPRPAGSPPAPSEPEPA